MSNSNFYIFQFLFLKSECKSNYFFIQNTNKKIFFEFLNISRTKGGSF